MRLFAAALLAALVLAGSAAAAERPRCGVPDYLLFGDSPLKRVSSAVVKQKRLFQQQPAARSHQLCDVDHGMVELCVVGDVQQHVHAGDELVGLSADRIAAQVGDREIAGGAESFIQLFDDRRHQVATVDPQRAKLAPQRQPESRAHAHLESVAVNPLRAVCFQKPAQVARPDPVQLLVHRGVQP